MQAKKELLVRRYFVRVSCFIVIQVEMTLFDLEMEEGVMFAEKVERGLGKTTVEHHVFELGWLSMFSTKIFRRGIPIFCGIG